MTALSRRHSQLTFISLALFVNIAASAIAHRQPRLAIAAALDMTATVTALYWWLVVRPGFRQKSTLIFIALLGFLRASFAFPQLIPGRFLVAAAIEVLLVVAVFAGCVPPAIRRALAGELSVFYYVFAWRAKPRLPDRATPFTLHKTSGIADLLMVLGPFSLFEIVPVHLLAAHWNAKLAWVLTGLGVYGALWAVAMGRSFALLPGYVTDTEIVVRFGLLFSLRIPQEAVRTTRHETVQGATRIPRRGVPNVYIELTRPLEAHMMFGFTKQLSAVGLSVDGNVNDLFPTASSRSGPSETSL